jgi:hypothetical protein
MQRVKLRQLIEVEQFLGDVSVTDAIASRQFAAMAALAYVVGRETNPELTYDDVLDMGLGDIEIVNVEPDDTEKVRGGSNGVPPSLSPTPGR